MYSMFLEIKLIQIKTLHVHIQILQWWCTPLSLKAGMESLKRRLSFRKKKNHVPECSKPHQWQEDEKKVRDGTCSFQVRVKNTTDTSLNYCSVKQNNLRMSLYFIECTLHVWFYPQCTWCAISLAYFNQFRNSSCEFAVFITKGGVY